MFVVERVGVYRQGIIGVFREFESAYDAALERTKDWMPKRSCDGDGYHSFEILEWHLTEGKLVGTLGKDWGRSDRTFGSRPSWVYVTPDGVRKEVVIPEQENEG